MREAGSRLGLHLRVSDRLGPWKAGTGVRNTRAVSSCPLGQKLGGRRALGLESEPREMGVLSAGREEGSLSSLEPRGALSQALL